jgi:hypothetical protein
MVRLTTGIVTLVLLAASIAGFAVQPPDAHFSEPQVRPSQVFRIEPVAPTSDPISASTDPIPGCHGQGDPCSRSDHRC